MNPFPDLRLELTSIRRSWITQAKPVVVEYAATHGAFTSDDVRPLLTEPEHANHFGVLFAQLRREGFLNRLGYQTSTRAAANGRPVALWIKSQAQE